MQLLADELENEQERHEDGDEIPALGVWEARADVLASRLARVVHEAVADECRRLLAAGVCLHLTAAALGSLGQSLVHDFHHFAATLIEHEEQFFFGDDDDDEGGEA